MDKADMSKEELEAWHNEIWQEIYRRQKLTIQQDDDNTSSQSNATDAAEVSKPLKSNASTCNQG